MRNPVLRLILVLSVLGLCAWVASASAAPQHEATASTQLVTQPRATESTRLVPDPYLEIGVVTTFVPMAIKCPCSIFINCVGRPVGYDCAEPANCCHCYGPDPANRICVFNAHP